MKEINVDLIIRIKEILSKQEYVLGIFLSGIYSEKDFDNNSKINIAILISEKIFYEKISAIFLEEEYKYKVNPIIWTLDEFQNNKDDLITKVFKEGKLIYWNSMIDIMASKIFRIKLYTLFIFDLINLKQNQKAKFNYNLYGKNNSGILNKLKGIRLTKSCFYVPFTNKYKITRFLDKFNIEFRNIEFWM